MAKKVIPGALLGTEEEFLAGPGTFSEKDNIYALLSGELKETSRKLEVGQGVLLQKLGVGSVVYGRIENVIEPIALVNVRPVPQKNARYMALPGFCVLHASRVKDGYVKNIHDELKIGDLVRAKVIELREGELVLSTKDPGLGVVKAFCARCRRSLQQEGTGLKCGHCGNKEHRKLANDYRKVVL